MLTEADSPITIATSNRWERNMHLDYTSDLPIGIQKLGGEPSSVAFVRSDPWVVNPSAVKVGGSALEGFGDARVSSERGRLTCSVVSCSKCSSLV